MQNKSIGILVVVFSGILICRAEISLVETNVISSICIRGEYQVILNEIVNAKFATEKEKERYKGESRWGMPVPAKVSLMVDGIECWEKSYVKSFGTIPVYLDLDIKDSVIHLLYMLEGTLIYNTFDATGKGVGKAPSTILSEVKRTERAFGGFFFRDNKMLVWFKPNDGTIETWDVSNDAPVRLGKEPYSSARIAELSGATQRRADLVMDARKKKQKEWEDRADAIIKALGKKWVMAVRRRSGNPYL